MYVGADERPCCRYSIYTYPASSTKTRSQLPLVGLVPLTNSSQAASEFYSVRNQHQPLTPDASGNVGITPDPGAAGRAVSGGIIALAVVLGFVALAGGIFCAWFFWLRRKHGTNGVVLGAKARKRKGSQPSEAGGASGDGDEDEVVDVVTRARRERKFKSMQRQKSMIDGYSDFDVDTNTMWSADAGDSVTTGDGKDDPFRSDVTDGLVTLDKGAGMGLGMGAAATDSAGRRSRARISAWESSYPPTGWKATDTSRDRSSGRTMSVASKVPSSGGVMAHDRTGSASTVNTNGTVDDDSERPPNALERFADPPASPSREALLGQMRTEDYEMGVRSPVSSGGAEAGKEYADGSILNITDPSRGRRS